jgi:hypothetical protein
MDLDSLTDALDRLLATDPAAYADAASIERLHGQLARFEALVAEVTRSWARGSGCGYLGARRRLKALRAQLGQ